MKLANAMEPDGKKIESDATWIKFSDLLVETGVISTWVDGGIYSDDDEQKP